MVQSPATLGKDELFPNLRGLLGAVLWGPPYLQCP